MANAGAINISLGAVTTDFVANMKVATQSVAQFREHFKSSFESLSGSVDKPKGAFNALNRSLLATRKEMRDILAVGGRVPDELTQKYRALKASIDTVNGAFRETKNQAGDSGSIFSGLGSSLLGMAAGSFTLSAAFSAVKSGLSITSDFQRLDASLQAVSASSADFLQTQSFLRTAADTYGLSLQALAGAYKGLKAASNGTVLQGLATEKIFIAVTKASAALKLSSDQTEGALLALQQMMSKGNVQAEELRGQLGERIPGAFKLFADAAGVSERELNKMLEAGEVAAVDILPRFAEQLERVYGDKAQANAETMAGGFQRMTDQLKLFVAEFAQSAGIDTFFGKLSNHIADYVKGIRAAQRLGMLTAALGPNGDIVRGAALAGEMVVERNRKTRSDFEGKGASGRAEDIAAQRAIAERAAADYKALYDQDKQTGVFSKATLKAAKDMNVQWRLLNDLISTNSRLSGKESAMANVAPTFEKLEKQLKGLKTRILDLRAAGKDGEADKLVLKYKALEKQIATIESPFGSVKKEKKADTWTERMRKDLSAVDGLIKEFKSKNPNIEVPLFLRMQKGILQDNLGIDDKIKLPKPAEIKTTYQRDLAGIGSDLQKLSLDVASKASKGLSRALQKTKIAISSEFNRDSASQIDLLSGIISKEAIADGVARLTQITRGGLAGFSENMASLMEIPRERQAAILQGWIELSEGISSSLTGAANSAASGMGELIGGLFAGTETLASLPRLFGGILGDLAQQIGKAMIAFGIGKIAIEKLAISGVGAVAAGIGLVALGAALKANISKSVSNASKPRAFASGGLIYGTTYAMMGEYPRAKSDPEVVSPLSKLAAIIQPMVQPRFNDRMPASRSASMDVNVYGELRLRNGDLVAAIRKGQKEENEYY